ncbi:MAG TPA: hypothetical protein VNL13_00550 [Sulfolobales archaeon]|nr:hypothetical protein [Sulfolobales archaeon]
MITRISLAMMLIILLTVSLTPTILSEAQYFRVVGVSWGAEASPGDLSVPLTVYVQYNGTVNLMSLIANLSLPEGFLSTSGEGNATAYSGPVTPGSIVPLTFYISISPSTSLGTYTAILDIVGQAQSLVIEQSLSVTIDLRGKANLIFDAFPRNLSPGDINEITLRIYNRGSGPAYNLSLSYSLQGPGSVLSTPLAIDLIPPGEYRDAKILIYVPPSSALQALSLMVTASYINPYYAVRTLSQSIGFYVGQQASQIISVKPLTQSVIAGQINNVSLRITNKGSSGIYNVIASVAPSQQAAIVGSDARFFIGDLAPSEYKDLSFNLYVGTQAPQIIPIQIQLSYTDRSGVQRSDLLTINLAVDYQPGYFQALSTGWGSLQQQIQVGPGDSGVTLVIAVRYIGNSTAYNVNFTLLPPNGIKILPNERGASQYVSSIQPNSIVQLSYQVSIDPSIKTGLYMADLAITWDTQSRFGYSQVIPVLLDIRGRVDLYISAINRSLEPGSINTVVLLITNNGTGTARQIGIMSIQSSIGSITSYDQRRLDLKPGESGLLSINIYIPPSAQQSPLSLLVAISYIDPYDYPRSYSQQLGLLISSQRQPLILLEPSTTSLKPGSINNISIRVSNLGDATIYNVSIGVSTQLQGSASLTPSQMLSVLSPGMGSIISYQIYVPSSAAGSTIILTFTVNYIDQYGVARVLSQQLGFYVVSLEQPQIVINISSNTIQPGLNNLSLYIVNRGGAPVYNLSLTITPASSLALVNSDGRIYVGDLPAGGVWSSQLTIFMARPSAIPQQMYSTSSVRVTLAYYDQSGSLRTETRDLSLIVLIQPIVSPIEITIDPQVLVTGIINNVTLYLKNTGSQSIDNITISIGVAGQLLMVGTTAFQVKRLSIGEQLGIPARIYVPATASTAFLQIDLRYYIDGTFYQEVRSVGVISRGIIELRVTDYTVIPETPSPGQVFSITVTLTNQGTITASAVTATPLPTRDFRIFGSRSVFIGDMQVNSPTTFTITLIALNTTSPGRYEIPIQLTFYDNLRTPNTVNISIPVILGEGLRATMTPRSAGGSGLLELSASWWVYIAIAAVIAFIAGVFVGRRR